MSPLVVIYLLHLLIFGRKSILNIKISGGRIVMNSYMTPKTVVCEHSELVNLKKSKWNKPIQDYYPDNFANCFGCER